MVTAEMLSSAKDEHTAEDANQSREVTMVRWVIESVNGRIKNVFKYFGGTLRNLSIPKTRKLFSICCALLNNFYPHFEGIVLMVNILLRELLVCLQSLIRFRSL